LGLKKTKKTKNKKKAAPL